jgi:Zn-finger nucleic acid-binding protein
MACSSRMSGPSMVCPACAQNMRPARVEDDPTWLCDGCGSFLMPRKQYQKLVGMTIAGRSVPENDGPHRACPGCRGPMAGVEVKGADIDFCPSCDIVVSGRASLSLIFEVSPERPELGSALLDLDVSRNQSNASRAQPVPRLQVENLFILYRNGILLASYTPKMPVEMDKDVVGSMLMAITEFVQTSFKGMAEDHPLSSIRFGEREIAFEHGSYIVVALTLRGTLEKDLRMRLSAAVREVESKNGSVLHSWDGNLGVLGGLDGVFEPVVRQVRTAG